MVAFEFLDPAVPEARSTLDHCGSVWFLAFATQSALTNACDTHCLLSCGGCEITKDLSWKCLENA